MVTHSMSEESIENNSSGPNVIPKYLLGISPKVKGNGHFYDEESIVYAYRNILVRYNLSSKCPEIVLNLEQEVNILQCFQFSDDCNMIIMGMSGSPPYVNVFERKTKKSSIYCKILQIDLPLERGQVWDVTMSCRRKYIGMITGNYHEPKILIIYSCELQSVVLQLRFTHYWGKFDRTLAGVLFNPVRPDICFFYGQGVFRTVSLKLEYKCGKWSCYYTFIGFYHAKNMNFTDGTWHTEDMVIAGTDDGRIAFLNHGQLLAIFNLYEMDEIFIPISKRHESRHGYYRWESLAHYELNQTEKMKSERKIRQIVSIRNGFAVGYKGRIVLYQNSWENLKIYKKTREFFLKQDIESYTVYPESYFIQRNIHFSPNFTKLNCCSAWKNVFIFDILKSDPVKATLLENTCLHDEKVMSISSCAWKPLVFSLSPRKLCLWNYRTMDLIAYFKIKHPGRSVSFHPDGYRTLVLSNWLRIYSLKYDSSSNVYQMSRIVSYKKDFRYGAFSDTGSYILASGWNSAIYIFSSYSYNILTFLSPGPSIPKAHIDEYNHTIICTGSNFTVMNNLFDGTKVFNYKNSTGNAGENTDVINDSEKKVCYCISKNGCLSRICYKQKSREILIEEPQCRWTTNLNDKNNVGIIEAMKRKRYAFDIMKNPQLINKESQFSSTNSENTLVVYLFQNELYCISRLKCCKAIIVGGQKGSLLTIYESTLENITKPEYKKPVHPKEIVAHADSISVILVTTTNEIITGCLDGSICIYELPRSFNIERKLNVHLDLNYTDWSTELLCEMVKRTEWKNICDEVVWWRELSFNSSVFQITKRLKTYLEHLKQLTDEIEEQIKWKQVIRQKNDEMERMNNTTMQQLQKLFTNYYIENVQYAKRARQKMYNWKKSKRIKSQFRQVFDNICGKADAAKEVILALPNGPDDLAKRWSKSITKEIRPWEKVKEDYNQHVDLYTMINEIYKLRLLEYYYWYFVVGIYNHPKELLRKYVRQYDECIALHDYIWPRLRQAFRAMRDNFLADYIHQFKYSIWPHNDEKIVGDAQWAYNLIAEEEDGGRNVKWLADIVYGWAADTNKMMFSEFGIANHGIYMDKYVQSVMKSFARSDMFALQNMALHHLPETCHGFNELTWNSAIQTYKSGFNTAQFSKVKWALNHFRHRCKHLTSLVTQVLMDLERAVLDNRSPEVLCRALQEILKKIKNPVTALKKFKELHKIQNLENYISEKGISRDLVYRLPENHEIPYLIKSSHAACRRSLRALTEDKIRDYEKYSKTSKNYELKGNDKRLCEKNVMLKLQCDDLYKQILKNEERIKYLKNKKEALIRIQDSAEI